jgi:hypothetical protein
MMAGRSASAKVALVLVGSAHRNSSIMSLHRLMFILACIEAGTVSRV